MEKQLTFDEIRELKRWLDSQDITIGSYSWNRLINGEIGMDEVYTNRGKLDRLYEEFRKQKEAQDEQPIFNWNCLEQDIYSYCIRPMSLKEMQKAFYIWLCINKHFNEIDSKSWENYLNGRINVFVDCSNLRFSDRKLVQLHQEFLNDKCFIDAWFKMCYASDDKIIPEIMPLFEHWLIQNEKTDCLNASWFDFAHGQFDLTNPYMYSYDEQKIIGAYKDFIKDARVYNKIYTNQILDIIESNHQTEKIKSNNLIEAYRSALEEKYKRDELKNNCKNIINNIATYIIIFSVIVVFFFIWYYLCGGGLAFETGGFTGFWAVIWFIISLAMAIYFVGGFIMMVLKK